MQQAVSTEDHRITITVCSNSEDSGSAHRNAKQPNVFYFGMEPPTEKRDDDANKTSAIAKVKRNEQVAIRGTAVSYTKRTPGEGSNQSPGAGVQKVKSPISSRSGEHTKSPTSGRSAEPVKSSSSGRSGRTKSPGSRRSDNAANLSGMGSPASLARIPSRKLAEFVSSLERSRQKRLSVSRDEILTNSSALSCKSQSSVFDLELDAGGDDSISMHLRPTLPRKQLEIPRFSPLSAWRSLTLDRAASRPWRGADTSDASDGPEPLMTTPPRRRRPHTKSADSGISGDASSPPPPPLAASSPAPDRADGWVPAHDLDLSSGGEESTSRQQRGTSLPPQLMSRTDMFPAATETPTDRGERHMSPHTFNSLRQMKRSVSTAIAALRRSPAHSLDENWLLSRSVPGSLNGVEEEAARPGEARSDVGGTGGRHVLYLPEYHSMPLPRRADRAGRATAAGRRGAGLSSTDLWSTGERSEHQSQEQGESLDRSRDESIDDHRHKQRTDRRDEYRKDHGSDRWDEHEKERRNEHRDANGSREELRDERREERRATPEKPPRTSLSTGKRRFSYQSTVRQLERRRLEARLSRLAEEEEQQRLNELHILHQVEQQFQRKRAKEQAEQQGLLNDPGPVSLPVVATGEPGGPAGGAGGWRRGEVQDGQLQEQQHGPVSLQIPACPPPDYTSPSAGYPGQDGPASLPVIPAHRSGKPRDKQKFLSGVRNWIRARKEAPHGADGAWQTAARLEPEGAPDVTRQDGGRHEGPQSPRQGSGSRPEMTRQEQVRQEALSAARERSGRPADKQRKSIYKQVSDRDTADDEWC